MEDLVPDPYVGLRPFEAGQWPLGIAALEDKVVQQAVVTILNQIYEVDFKGFSISSTGLTRTMGLRRTPTSSRTSVELSSTAISTYKED